jgi:hypothetical protein
MELRGGSTMTATFAEVGDGSPSGGRLSKDLIVRNHLPAFASIVKVLRIKSS